LKFLTGVDEFETITLIYENNRMASLTVSCNCGREDSAVIVGSKGWLRVCSNFPVLIYIKT
jgi:hypothetical protein